MNTQRSASGIVRLGWLLTTLAMAVETLAKSASRTLVLPDASERMLAKVW